LGQKILKKLEDSNAFQMENDLHAKLKEYVLKLNEEVENYQIELKTYMEKEFRKEKKRLEEVRPQSNRLENQFKMKILLNKGI
jgi:hypothetical protein